MRSQGILTARGQTGFHLTKIPNCWVICNYLPIPFLRFLFVLFEVQVPTTGTLSPAVKYLRVKPISTLPTRLRCSPQDPQLELIECI